MSDLRIVDVPEIVAQAASALSSPSGSMSTINEMRPLATGSGNDDPSLPQSGTLAERPHMGKVAHMSEAARRSLEELQASILFAPDFPRRITYTHAEHLELLKARSTKMYAPGLEAIERARDQWDHLRSLVDLLGRERYEPSVPILARLWKDCALQPVWVAVGHALFKIATPEAMAVLLSSIEDHDSFGRHMAIKAAFARGSNAAFDCFDQRFGIADGGHWILTDLLYFLRRDGVGSTLEDRLNDPRWVDACARHRRHPELGHAAREVLRVAPAKDREKALREAKAAEAPDAPARVRRDGNLLKRYQAGEFEQVWRDIRSHERIDGGFRDEVTEVAEAAMRRVAQNADLVAERLRAVGWQALARVYQDLRTLPKPGDLAVFVRIEEISGAQVPPTLLAFWRVVGGINWVWDYDAAVDQPNLGFDLPPEEHDALCVDAPGVISYLFKEWIDEKARYEPDLRHPFRIDLAPDYLHKANISGGGPYHIKVPFSGADPVVADERHGLPFLDYLRLAFRWAGFPGLDRHVGRRDVQDFVARFGKGLLPF
jgi:hypothetical protein